MVCCFREGRIHQRWDWGGVVCSSTVCVVLVCWGLRQILVLFQDMLFLVSNMVVERAANMWCNYRFTSKLCLWGFFFSPFCSLFFPLPLPPFSSKGREDSMADLVVGGLSPLALMCIRPGHMRNGGGGATVRLIPINAVVPPLVTHPNITYWCE